MGAGVDPYWGKANEFLFEVGLNAAKFKDGDQANDNDAAAGNGKQVGPPPSLNPHPRGPPDRFASP
jgi:hypothetical protein